MAETQEKRTDDSAKGVAADNNQNQKTNQTGNNTQSNASGVKSSSDNQNSDKTSITAGISSIDPKEIFNQAKETAGQAYGKVSEQASSQIVTQKENLARGLSSVADNIRQMGENLRGGDAQETPIANLTAKYGDSLAGQVEQISNYLEKKDLRELVKDVEVFARRNPAVFIGGAFALGIAAARFLKSGNPNQTSGRRPRRDKGGIYIPDKSEGVYLPKDLGKKVGLADNSRSTGADTSGTGTKTSSTGLSSTGDQTSKDAFSPNTGG